MTTAVPFIEPFTEEQGASQAAQLFIEQFGYEPQGVWAAPGRVNIIGEHTDYNGGLCLPIALPHRTYIALAPRDDTGVRIVSDINPQEVTVADLEGLQAGDVQGWGAYPIGVAWALREAGYDQVCGFDAAVSSCVPLGSGLSSSAAMTCAMAVALNDVANIKDTSRRKLINAAIRAENEMAGASTGGLDQSAAMLCSQGHAIRLDCANHRQVIEPIAFDLAQHGLAMLVLDTRAPHQLNDGQYASRRATCEQAASLLGVSELREIADQVNAADDPQAALDEVLEQCTDETMRKRVRHVITEIGRVDKCIDAFARGDMHEVGALWNASHDSLRDDYEVTVPELDVAVNVAWEAGALGARMTGGGFGGSIIALVQEDQVREVAQRIADEFARQGFAQPQALPVQPSDAAQRVR